MNCYKPTSVVLKVLPRNSPAETEPLTYLLVEWRDNFKHDSQGVLMEASICVTCQQIKPQQYHRKYRTTHFHGGYLNSQKGIVSLTANTVITGGFVVIEDNDLVGHRVGTFLMSEIVSWVKQWPTAQVRSVSLGSGQAQTENKDRRNHFYESLGLSFIYDDPEHKSGHSLPIQASQLKIVDTWKQNISLISLPEYIGELIRSKERDSDELERLTRIGEKLTQKIQKARAQPFRTAFYSLLNKW